jgi:hypothetical protein
LMKAINSSYVLLIPLLDMIGSLLQVS